MQEEQLSPEQKEYRQMKREFEKLKSEKQKQEEDLQKTSEEASKTKYVQEYQKTIADALTQTGMPRTARNVAEMASLMKKNLALGLDLSAKELAQEYRDEQLGNFNSLKSDPKSVLEFLGPETAAKVLKEYLAEIKKSQKTLANNPKVVETDPRTKQRSAKSFDQWRAELDKKLKD